MLHVLGKAPAVSEVADPLVTHFGDVFQRDMSSAVGMTLPARRSAVV